MFRRGKPKKFASLGEALPRVLRRLELDRVVEEERAIGKWPSAAGPETARHSQAVAIKDGTLLVAVDSPVWMTQLTYLKPQLLRAMARHTRRGLVKDIRFVLKRASRPL